MYIIYPPNDIYMCRKCHFDTRNFKKISLPLEGGHPLNVFVNISQFSKRQ